jgi:hypothetical protein
MKMMLITFSLKKFVVKLVITIFGIVINVQMWGNANLLIGDIWGACFVLFSVEDLMKNRAMKF